VEDSAIEAAAHGCSLQYHSGDAVTIAGDPELLRRAVENVLRNAIHYEPRDSCVEVRLRRGAPRPWWKFAIMAREFRKMLCRGFSIPSIGWNPTATG
jgi:signal transduction histidine kinase